VERIGLLLCRDGQSSHHFSDGSHLDGKVDAVDGQLGSTGVEWDKILCRSIGLNKSGDVSRRHYLDGENFALLRELDLDSLEWFKILYHCLFPYGCGGDISGWSNVDLANAIKFRELAHDHGEQFYFLYDEGW
jgi:hypothetical protein